MFVAIVGVLLALRVPDAAGFEYPRQLQGVGIGAPGATGAADIAVSTGDEHAYVAALDRDAIVVLDRDPGDGMVTVVQTLVDGTGGVDGLDGVAALAISPDGMHVYAAGSAEQAVAVFARDPVTGELTFVEVERDGVGGVDGLAAPQDVVVSPDGAHVYVASFPDDSVAVFARDTGTGALTFSAVVRDGVGGVQHLVRPVEMAMSPDGMHVYVAGAGVSGSGWLVAFARDPGTGGLTYVGSTTDARRPVVSADGTHVYALQHVMAGPRSVVAFDRQPSTGVLTAVQELREGKSGLPALDSESALALAADGRYLYVSTSFFPRLIQLERNPISGMLAHQYTAEMQSVGSGAVPVGVSADGLNQYFAQSAALLVARLRTVACTPTPMASCRLPGIPGVGKLSISPGKTLKWKRVRGSATTEFDFSGNDYALCVYDAGGGPQPRVSAAAPGGGYCVSRPCWIDIGPTLKYRDRTRASGLGKLWLQDGAEGQARVVATGGGPRLSLEPLPLVPPVTAQLQKDDGNCWQARYTTALVNDGTQFRAIAD